MFKDLYGNTLSTQQAEVVQSVNLFSQELLRMGKKVDSILEAVDQYPDEIILQLYATMFYLYGQTTQTQELAKKHLDQAALLLDRANPREVSLYKSANSWYNQQLTEALTHFENHCYHWPKDLTALKTTEFLFYCKGQKYEGKRFVRLTSYCYPEHKDNPFFLAIHSFALELTKKYEESMQAAKQALDINEENPWAHHTLSHLYINQGLITEGIDVLEHYAQMWKDFNPLIESHNSWHLALLYLENLEFEKIQALYKQANWASKAQFVGEEIDAAALLWRLDFEGEDNSLQWKQLADSIQDHANFGGMPFLSAQLCYALKRGQREDALEEALSTLKLFAQNQTKEDRFVWQEIGLPLVYGSLAYADKDYVQALNYFDPIMDKVSCVGGSDAQVDVFNQAYLKTLIGAKRFWEAQSFLHHLTQGRNLTRLERKWLSECQETT